jgi:hypothetical protein
MGIQENVCHYIRAAQFSRFLTHFQIVTKAISLKLSCQKEEEVLVEFRWPCGYVTSSRFDSDEVSVVLTSRDERT